MIAEPGILSTSPWNSDLLLKDLQSDFFRSYVSVNDVVDMGFPLMDIDNDSWTRNGRGDSKQAFSSSCSPSSASSECSEEFNLEFDGSLFSSSCAAAAAAQFLPLVDHDYLNTSFSLLGDDDNDNCISVSSSPTLPAQQGDCDFDWVAGDDLVISSVGSFCDKEEDEELERESSSEDTFVSDACLTALKVNRTRPIGDAVASNKLWSKMVLSEQLEVVDALTNIVSNQMGLREQLDIIRIIEPSAVISPTDKEFVIDLNCLSDRKLFLVRDYVRRVQAVQEARQNKSGKQNCFYKRASSGVYSSNSSVASTSPIRNTVTKGDSNSSPIRGKSSKKEAKEKRPPQKVFRQRQKKEYKQLLKERRSGLFEREEVLSLTTMAVSIEEENDDIDIIG